MIVTKTIDRSPLTAEVLSAPEIQKQAAQFRLRAGLVACSLFALLNLGGLTAYNVSLKFWDSQAARAARETGQFDPTVCLKDLPMFNWALQDGYERTLDAKSHKLAAVSKPDVVLLGSSLMIFPLWFADHGDNLPDQAYYAFRSNALEKKCTQAHNICNLALPLLNASDAERLVETQLVGDKSPRVLVYGVGPRDFYDAFIAKPEASVYFERLSNVDDFTKNWNSYFSNPVDVAACLGKRLYFLFSKRDEILLLGKSISKQVLHLNKPTTTVPLTEMGPRRNLEEYQGHYKNISNQALDREFSFLDKLLTVCSKRHIQVILLSMPLTKENRSLIPTEVYASFNRRLGALAAAKEQKFLNLNGTEFATSDFLDSAHLNAKGAHKLVDLIAPSIDAAVVDARGNNE